MAKYTEWSKELEDELAKPFPKEQHMNKGSKGTFVSVPHYVHRLNDLVGVSGWSMPTPVPYHSGNKLGLAVGVTILGVTKWNVGDEMEDHGEPDEDGKVRDFGSSSTNSWAQGFKRCLAYGFRLGLYLYDKDFTRNLLSGRTERTESPRAVDSKPAAAKAATETNGSQNATDTQLTAIGRLVEQKQVEHDLYGTIQKEIAGAMSYTRAAELIKQLDKLPKAEAVR